MDLSNITIVILSRGREEILTKTLRYWSKFDISVLVLHNTEHPINSNELSPNIRYIVKQLNYGERCGEVPNYLLTDYAILSSDDELYIPSALEDMKRVLINDSSLVSVGGLTVAVSKYGPLHTAVPCYTNMSTYSNLEETNFERLLNHFSESQGYRNGAMYRLMRKELMTAVMKTFSMLYQIATPYIYEVTGEIVINALGKSVYIPNIYWVRNWINLPVGHRSWDRKLYFSTWVSDGQYKRDFIIWNQQIQHITNLDHDEYSRIITKILELRKSSEDYERQRLSRRSFPIPSDLKFLIRKMLAPESLPPSIESTLKSMEIAGAKFNRIELLAAIESII